MKLLRCDRCQKETNVPIRISPQGLAGNQEAIKEALHGWRELWEGSLAEHICGALACFDASCSVLVERFGCPERDEVCLALAPSGVLMPARAIEDGRGIFSIGVDEGPMPYGAARAIRWPEGRGVSLSGLASVPNLAPAEYMAKGIDSKEDPQRVWADARDAAFGEGTDREASLASALSRLLSADSLPSMHLIHLRWFMGLLSASSDEIRVPGAYRMRLGIRKILSRAVPDLLASRCYLEEGDLLADFMRLYDAVQVLFPDELPEHPTPSQLFAPWPLKASGP